MSSSGPIDGKMLLSTSLKQTQRLIMSPQMQQAIQLLQVQAMELASVIEQEMEQNPLLEYDTDLEDPQEPEEGDAKTISEEGEGDGGSEEGDPEISFDDDDFRLVQDLEDEFGDHWEQSGQAYGKTKEDSDKLQNYLESSIISEESLYEHLLKQSHETFTKLNDLAAAEAIIGNIDSSGYLKTPLEEIAILCNTTTEHLEKILLTIQTFDPPGVGARSLQEALLIELRLKGSENSLAYRIARDCYQELLHNQIPSISKSLHCPIEEVKTAITEEIASLDLHPGLTISRDIVQTIVPDVTIKQEGDELIVSINDDQFPSLRLNKTYLKMLLDENLNKETKEFIKKKILSAKWLLRNIFQRNDTIERIARVLAEKQKAFFINPEGALLPMTMRAMADELSLHESTIARAVSNKYIDTPRGIFPLRFFFTNAYSTLEGEDISSDTVRRSLKEIIDSEEKSKPYSDFNLSKMLQAKGISCARRTIAKYRVEMGIGNAQHRKQY
ncbi:MAG: RNA polymerase factor sigma-54 [Parachlamydiales bacterium]|jgi:RNA polymerase sigma-54 factor